jgi:ADP-ribose pyrophosphatase YjhB (NUDIX family)
MEVGESVEEGALREAAEEADIKARSRGLLAMYSIPKGGQVHIFVRATVDESHVASSACTLGDVNHSPTFYGCGPESLETRAFAPADIPWEDLAFPTVRDAIAFYLRDPHSTSVDVKTITEPLPPPGAKLAPPEVR